MAEDEWMEPAEKKRAELPGCSGPQGCVGFAITGGFLLFGLIGLLLVVPRIGSSPREWIADHYRRVSADAGTHSAVYASSETPSTVVRALTDDWSPIQRHTDPSGYFLRYSDTIVAVSLAEGGSRIYVDDAERGYARWYSHVGGYWGTYTGPGDGFRGGGPGAGK